MLVIDWGTTNLRAYLCHDDGLITAKIDLPQGIKAITPGQYPEILQQIRAELDVTADEPVYVCGMAGARGGWIEAPYCQTPVSIEELKASLLFLPDTSQGKLVPGIKTCAADGTLDVIRGEEIQIFGALQKLNVDDALICLPGTHSKWVSIQDRQITTFMTFMTGDLFAGLNHTILNCRSEDSFDQQVFLNGLEASQKSSGGLLHQLFTARTRMLANDLTEEQVSSFVSGLLIGHELSEAELFRGADERVVIIGSDKLCLRYQLALAQTPLKVETLGSDIATCTGVAVLHHLFDEESNGTEF